MFVQRDRRNRSSCQSRRGRRTPAKAQRNEGHEKTKTLTLPALRNAHEQPDPEERERDQNLNQQWLDVRVLDRRVRVDQNPPGSADDNPDEDGDDEDCDGLKDVSSEEQKARGLMSAGSIGRVS